MFGADGVATSPAVTALEIEGGSVPDLLAGMAEDRPDRRGLRRAEDDLRQDRHMGDHRPVRLEALLERLAARLLRA